jgi:hypothetical protein
LILDFLSRKLCMLAEDRFQNLNSPISVNEHRVSGLHFADPRVHLLWRAIILFRLLADGFRTAGLCPQLAALAARSPGAIRPGDCCVYASMAPSSASPCSHRYPVTDAGFRTALFFIRLDNRLLRPSLTASISDRQPARTLPGPSLSCCQQPHGRIAGQHQIRSSNSTNSQTIPRLKPT